MATSTSAVPLAFDVISHRLHALDVPEVDVVVGIATGGRTSWSGRFPS
ncbi:MAG: hypothetical protein P8Y02_06630 [Deinococcales bacterium]